MTVSGGVSVGAGSGIDWVGSDVGVEVGTGVNVAVAVDVVWLSAE